MNMARIYQLTALLGLIGFVSYFAAQGPRSGLGFALGAATSFGNLWLFDWLSRAIAPAGAPPQKWQGGLFVGRYLILFTFGYVIVKALGVNPLAVVLGLLASTAAVILSITVELLQSLLGNRRTN
jgi:hypothetical protein